MLCRIFAIKGNALGCPKTGGRVMLAVISGQCDCGMHVKAMHETDGMRTVRPQSFCNITHIVDGSVTELWIKPEPAPADWRRHEVASLVVR